MVDNADLNKCFNQLIELLGSKVTDPSFGLFCDELEEKPVIFLETQQYKYFELPQVKLLLMLKLECNSFESFVLGFGKTIFGSNRCLPFQVQFGDSKVTVETKLGTKISLNESNGDFQTFVQIIENIELQYAFSNNILVQLSGNLC